MTIKTMAPYGARVEAPDTYGRHLIMYTEDEGVYAKFIFCNTEDEADMFLKTYEETGKIWLPVVWPCEPSVISPTAVFKANITDALILKYKPQTVEID